MFQVSVIIPAYKSERFIETAINSCVNLNSVLEVLVVIDGVYDDTPAIVENLRSKNQKIKILFHPNQSNCGAAASRNLGIVNASAQYVSFLDADDFYLPNRFEQTKSVFEKYSDADGVYEAIGTHAYDQQSYERHIQRIKDCNIEGLNPELTTLVEEVSPSELFQTIVYGKKGWFHFNGLTLKKEAVKKAGLIKSELNRFGEDNEFFIRLSLKTKMYPGNIKTPVAMRGVYSENQTLQTFSNDEMIRKTYLGSVVLHQFLLKEILHGNYDKSFNRFVLMRFLDNFSVSFMLLKPGNFRKLHKLLNFIGTIFTYPGLIRKI